MTISLLDLEVISETHPFVFLRYVAAEGALCSETCRTKLALKLERFTRCSLGVLRKDVGMVQVLVWDALSFRFRQSSTFDGHPVLIGGGLVMASIFNLHR